MMASNERDMPQDDVSVLIAGGGPTGLTAALLLAQQGVPAMVVERRPGPSAHPRARGLNVRTMEIFRSLGLEEPVRAAGAALAASRYMLFVETLAGREIRRLLDADLAPVGEALAAVTPCDWCRCAQDELEPILVAAARDHGAGVCFGTELVAFEQDAGGVTAALIDRPTGERRSVRARYLIAADGARSGVRRALGIGTDGIGPVERGSLGRFVNVLFRADLGDLVRGREFLLCFVERPGAEGLLLAVDNRDRWLFNVAYAPERGESPADFPPDRCAALVRAAVGRPELAVEVESVLPWEAAALVAERFRFGRVVLAGDAAHPMPPAGAFGLNAGVQDADNLAWKLALLLRGAAGPALLDSYEAERRPVAQAVVDRAVRELLAPTPDGRVDDGDPDDGGWGDAAEFDPLDQLGPILGHRYRSSAVVAEAGDDAGAPVGGLDLSGRPGTRAPHVWVRRDGVLLSTLDLVDGRFVLMTGPAGAAWRDAAAVASDSEVEVAAEVIGGAGGPIDPDGRWRAANGVGPAGAVLIRPDGVVGWRSVDGSASPAALRAALGRILGQ